MMQPHGKILQLSAVTVLSCFARRQLRRGEIGLTQRAVGETMQALASASE